jgi:HEAT repeat protein
VTDPAGGVPTGPAARRRRAVAVAGHRGDVARAREGLADRDPAVRSSALLALERAGALGDDDIAAAAGDESAVVRRRAAEVAAGHPDVPLLELLDDADPSVVEMAAWACGEHEQAEPAVLTQVIDLAGRHRDALVREAAVAALGAIGDPRGLPAILAACTDKPAVRRRAVLALAPFDGEAVDAALRTALDDRDWQVRQAADDLLREE